MEAEGILLAAGLSSRSGGFKMELLLAGKPLLLWSLEAMAAVCQRVIVVAGFAPEKIRRLVEGRPGVEVVVNENFAAGMLGSIQTGCRAVRAGRFFVHPGDMPLVRSRVYRQLLATEAEVVVPACRGRRGHPVLLRGNLIPALLAEPLDSSLGQFIARRAVATVEVEDRGILADLDVMADLKKIEALLPAGGENE
ncbi:MAG: NTP transferase domain-containing protein [Candidatus Aminicenantes bacterium]|nr:NTP transferase domain-containing protein [Candidatus Aminicenantes bacterium]